MDLYPCNDRSLEDPFLSVTDEMSYREYYGGPEAEFNEPWAVYDPG